MRIASLEAFGVPSQLLAVWENALSTELLPIQERAVVQYKVLAGANLLVQAPTSAGKTFIGEMAATRAALASRKVLYLVPTKALAEDKYAHFRRLYSSLGLRMIACTRDRRGDEERFTTGDFDIAIAIPEKVRALWAHGGVSQFLGLAVVDELQTLSEPERGPCLELLLAQLRALPNLQIIGLSACLGASPKLAEYLRAGWLESTERPVELRKGILVGDTFRYRDGHGNWTSEYFAGGGLQEGDSFDDAAARLALHFASAGEQTIIFVRDRVGAMRLAAAVAEGLGAGEESTASGFDSLERTTVREQLQRLIGYGAGFHSSDLQFEDRRAVEAGFATGQLRVLCATPTLALGVNLPAQNVIIDPSGWHSEAAGGRAALSPISRSQYENRAGRAGRLGYGGFGRAILLADCELAASALTARYLDGDFSATEPALATLPPLQTVLQLAAGAAGGNVTLDQAYAQTYTAYLNGLAGLAPPLQEAARRCQERSLVAETPNGHLAPTALGRIAAASGVTFDTFNWLNAWATRASMPPTNLEAALVSTLAGESQGCSTWGLGGGVVEWAQALREQAGELGEAGGLLGALLASGERGRQVRDRAARQTLALLRWMSPEVTYEVEAAVRLPAARLLALGETVGWLVDTLADIGAELGWPLADCRRLRSHAECLALGVSPEGRSLGRLKVFGLGRDHIQALVQAGVQTPREAIQAGRERLAQIIPSESVEELWETLARGTKGQPVQRAGGTALPDRSVGRTTTATPAISAAALVLCGDRPDRALFYGRRVALRPAEFRLLCALAENVGKCVRYDTLYQRMWEGDRFVEPGQIYSHRSRLCGKLARALPERDTKEIVVTVPRHGLMLNLPREEVEVS